MKKRLLAFVLVVALLGGFAQSFTHAKPASAQGLCNPGYEEDIIAYPVPVFSKKGILKAIINLYAGVCYNGASVYAGAVWATPGYQANWIFDPSNSYYILVPYGNRIEIDHHIRWNKYKDGFLHGFACATLRVTVNAQGQSSIANVFFDRDCDGVGDV